jgi:hypothetical protein
MHERFWFGNSQWKRLLGRYRHRGERILKCILEKNV